MRCEVTAIGSGGKDDRIVQSTYLSDGGDDLRSIDVCFGQPHVVGDAAEGFKCLRGSRTDDESLARGFTDGFVGACWGDSITDGDDSNHDLVRLRPPFSDQGVRPRFLGWLWRSTSSCRSAQPQSGG